MTEFVFIKKLLAKANKNICNFNSLNILNFKKH